jgi:hypothetical protein
LEVLLAAQRPTNGGESLSTYYVLCFPKFPDFLASPLATLALGTVADLTASDVITPQHVSEGIQYRTFDRTLSV